MNGLENIQINQITGQDRLSWKINLMYRVSQLIGKKSERSQQMMKEISNIVSVANEWVTETPFPLTWSRVSLVREIDRNSTRS